MASYSGVYNNNNNIEYDNKCINHPTQDILYICSTCDNQPACSQCVTSKDHHRGHNFDDIDLDVTTKLFNEFKINHNKLNCQVLATDTELANESTKTFNQLEDKHNKNLESIKDQFKQLHTILDTVEKDSIRQLITHFDDNQEIYTKINSQIESNNLNIKTITEKYNNKMETYNINDIFNNNNNNNNNNKRQHIEIIKYNQLAKTILNNEIKKKKVLDEYSVIKNQFNDKSITLVKDSIKTIHTIKKVSYSFYNHNHIEFNGIKFTVYHDGDKINSQYLALGPDVTDLKVGSIPRIVTQLLILGGFSQDLEPNLIPDSVTNLYIGEIARPLIRGSIPNSATTLYFINGFNQKTSNAIFPQINGLRLYLGDCTINFENNEIPPNLVYYLSKSPECKSTVTGSYWINGQNTYSGYSITNWVYPQMNYL